MTASDTHHRKREQTRPAQGWRGACVALLMLTSTASSAFAQNYSFDARRIALGGAGGTPNVASKLVERQRRYKTIVIPLGLVRVLKNVSVFYPNLRDFDFSSAVEFATRPFHQVIGPVENHPGFNQLVDDIRDARLNSDPNAYSGFETARLDFVEGLIAPNWGYTFMLHEDDRSFQGIYVGAGPYVAVRADYGVNSDFGQSGSVPPGSGNRPSVRARAGPRRCLPLEVEEEQVQVVAEHQSTIVGVEVRAAELLQSSTAPANRSRRAKSDQAELGERAAVHLGEPDLQHHLLAFAAAGHLKQVDDPGLRTRGKGDLTCAQHHGRAQHLPGQMTASSLTLIAMFSPGNSACSAARAS